MKRFSTTRTDYTEHVEYTDYLHMKDLCIKGNNGKYLKVQRLP